MGNDPKGSIGRPGPWGEEPAAKGADPRSGADPGSADAVPQPENSVIKPPKEEPVDKVSTPVTKADYE